jgi:hypothetical protein
MAYIAVEIQVIGEEGGSRIKCKRVAENCGYLESST